MNENLHSIQKMIGVRSSTEQAYVHSKQPFAPLTDNIQRPQAHNLKQQDEMDVEDFDDQESQGLEEICNNHESLVNLILQEEEDLLSSHRKYIDEIVESVKKQMVLLHEVDKPGSNVDEYLSSLDEIMLGNMQMIQGIRKRVKKFERHLREEENLSQRFYESQRDEDMQQNDEYFDQKRKPHNGNGGNQDFEDDEFMDDLDYLEITPSEPPIEDNLTKDVVF